MGEPAREWLLVLPWDKPPLSANQRVHWAKRARLTKQVVGDVQWLVRAQRIPSLGRCSVQLHYRPLTNRHRDTDNLVASLKPVCDAIVREGLVPDDTPAYMVKPEPIIHPWAKRVRLKHRVLWVVVTEMSS